MSIFEQQRNQFIAKHGNSILVENFGFIFEDGAVMGMDCRGPYEEPDRLDARELAHRRILFHKAHLNRAVVVFNSLKSTLEQKALAAIKSGCGLVTDEEMDRLDKLHEEVNQKKENLEAVQAALRPTQRMDDAATIAERQKHQQEASEALARLRSLRV